MFNFSTIDAVREKYHIFLNSLFDGQDSFRFTSQSEVTPYARCFAIFGFQLLKNYQWLSSNSEILASAIRNDLCIIRDQRKSMGVNLKYDKPYLQLLCFSLSALSILGRLDIDPLQDHVEPLLSNDIESDLMAVNALQGIPRSGNQAMFMVIMLCHARKYLGINTDHLIRKWEQLHLKYLNIHGFWGEFKTMSHLQFQNGYHQYELMDYLNTEGVPWDKAADQIAALSDKQGHFAPYIGGGGCYDYDAVYILTGAGKKAVERHKKLLMSTAESILSEQNTDGGFCESHCVRPRSIKNLSKSVFHIFSASGIARVERLRQFITLLRPKYNRIDTHWSIYSRRWNESDLWDSWFRMLTVARIDVALNSDRFSDWGFIDYPGIGFHRLLKDK